MAVHEVPDHVVFGPRRGGGADLTFGDVRNALSIQGKIEALRDRCDRWLIQQSKPLADSKGSPFPLAVMACVGIEALGQIAFGEGLAGSPKSYAFVSVADRIDSRFRDPPTPGFLAALVARLPRAPAGKGSELFYTFFRNSMIHGYRGRSVFLTGDEVHDVALRESDGTMVLNPWWLWAEYEKVATTLLDEIERPTASTPRRSCAESYMSRMLR